MPRAPTEIRSIARTHSRLAIRTLRQVAAAHDAPPAARVSAAIALLDRGWGRPEQQVEVAVKQADLMTDAELNAEIARLELLLGAQLALPAPEPTDLECETSETQH